MELKCMYDAEMFGRALLYLKSIKEEEGKICNELIVNHVEQMLDRNRRRYVEDNDGGLIEVKLNFEDKIHARIACAFWSAVYADVKASAPMFQPMALEMYYNLVFALENKLDEEGVN